MRIVSLCIAIVALGACGASEIDERRAPPAAAPAATPVAVAFDGADASDEAARVEHGKRLATMFACNGCHGANYTGWNFGEAFPIVEGLWASNISLTLPQMSDADLERLLREGVLAGREIYVMPSKQTQFLSAPDMAALVAFLRTIPPAGEPTPLPPEGFEAAVTARLPDDYWLTQIEGTKRSYHNAAEEVAYFAAHPPPDLGPELARGRMIAASVCSSCHGAALDGVGEPAGDIQGALAYDDAAFERLLVESVDRTGRKVAVEWGFGHEAMPLTAAERRDVVAYVRALASDRASLVSLRAADASMQEAVTARDLEAILAHYADDAVLLPAAEPKVEGRAALRAEWQHVLAIPGFSSVSALSHAEVSAAGDLGYTYGTYSTRMLGEDGQPVTEPGKWLAVWRRQPDGAWRIVVETYNTDVPPPDHQ